MAKLTIKDLEQRMTPTEIKVAYAMVEYEFANKADRKTINEIAEELQMTRQALYAHRQKPDVIRLVNLLSERQLDAFQIKVDKALTRLIDDGSDRLPSIKAIELFYKMKGLLIERSIVGSTEEDVTPVRISDDELTKELNELNNLLK